MRPCKRSNCPRPFGDSSDGSVAAQLRRASSRRRLGLNRTWLLTRGIRRKCTNRIRGWG